MFQFLVFLIVILHFQVHSEAIHQVYQQTCILKVLVFPMGRNSNHSPSLKVFFKYVPFALEFPSYFVCFACVYPFIEHNVATKVRQQKCVVPGISYRKSVLGENEISSCHRN